MDDKPRCMWGYAPAIYRAYHDHEWGVPLHDDRRLFEMLNLEGAQAGVSWLLVLQKREHYRLLFDQFDAEKMARYSARKVQALLNDPRIIRNRLKITGAVANARAFLTVREEFGSFDRYLWQFVGGWPVMNAWRTQREVPAQTAASQAMSKDLKRRGFKFVGPTICYAFMQAVGMVNDHTTDCFCYARIVKKYGPKPK